MRVSIRIVTTLLIVTSGLSPVCAGQDNGPLGVIVIRNGDEQVMGLKETVDRHGYADSPLAKAAQRSPGIIQAQVGLLGISAMAGTTPWEGVGALLGERTTIAIAMGSSDTPRMVAVSTLRDPEAADRFLDAILAVAGLRVGGEPRDGATRQIAGQTVYVAGELYLCRTQGLLVVANDSMLIESALEGLDDGVFDLPESLADIGDVVPRDATIWAAIDIVTLRDAGMDIPEKLADAFGGLLFGGWVRAFADADRAVAWATAEESALELTVDIHREGEWPDTHRGYLAPDSNRHVPLSFDNAIGEVMVTRQWASLFGERESLLTLNASGKAVEFATNISAIMGQLDFIEDVLPRVSGAVRLIAVNRDAGELSVDPTPTLPAMALIAPLDLEGVDLAQRLYSGGQMLMTIVSFERSQMGKASLMMDMDEHRGIRLVTGSFGAPAGGHDVVGVEYNFEPALAVVDGQLVIASTKNLLISIVDQVLDGGGDVGDAGQDSVWISGAQLAMILGENREELVANRVLEKGKSKAVAAADIDALLGALRLIANARLDAGVSETGGRATLRLTLDEQ